MIKASLANFCLHMQLVAKAHGCRWSWCFPKPAVGASVVGAVAFGHHQCRRPTIARVVPDAMAS